MPARRPAPLYKRRNNGLRVITSNATIDIKDAEEQRGRKRQRTSDTDRFGVPATARTSKSPELKRKRVLLRNPSKSPFKRPAPPSPISPVTPDEEDSFEATDPDRTFEAKEGEEREETDEDSPEDPDRTFEAEDASEVAPGEKEEESFSDFEDPDRTLVAENPSDLKDYHEIVPGVFLAVAVVNIEDDVPKSFEDDVTHIIRVTPGKAEEWSDSDEKSSTEILNLSVPMEATTRGKAGDADSDSVAEETCFDGVLNLSSEQLRVARDFLSLALPYYSESNPPSPLPKTSGLRPKALIIAPTHIDALSIAVTYLAFCSGEHAFSVIQYIDDEPEVPEAWRNVFPVLEVDDEEAEEIDYGESAKVVELAARLEV